MHIRQKDKNIRVTLDDTAGSRDVDYVAINVTSCWSATFNAWGKKADAPVVQIGSKKFKIAFEEMPAAIGT